MTITPVSIVTFISLMMMMMMMTIPAEIWEMFTGVGRRRWGFDELNWPRSIIRDHNTLTLQTNGWAYHEHYAVETRGKSSEREFGLYIESVYIGLEFARSVACLAGVPHQANNVIVILSIATT